MRLKKLLRKPYLAIRKYTIGRPIQDVLDIVLSTTPYSHTQGMCASLSAAYVIHGAITRKEYRKTRKSIMGYVWYLSDNDMFLCAALRKNDLPRDRIDCLVIYKDWANRPMPKRNHLKKV